MTVVEDVLSSRLAILREIVRGGFEDAPAQVQGFVARVLQPGNQCPSDVPLFQPPPIEDCLEAVRFDGYPALARAGYGLGCETERPISGDLANKFIGCIDQQRDRPASKHAELARDAVALLGIGDGLRAISEDAQQNAAAQEAAKAWSRELLERHGGSDPLHGRARLLASDLLDDQGRFGRQLAHSDDTRVAALDLCLWRTWPDVLRNVEHPETSRRRELFKRLLTAPVPGQGELICAASWLVALDVLTDRIAAVAVPDATQVAQILAETQGSFRRWRWEKKATRKNAIPARWLIDKEPDVQAFLLAMLYPYFTGQLEDEQYLRGFGLRQGRFDFAITSLGLIVEVKVLRRPGDIETIEADVADDLALYFREGNPFRSMIVYIYDDRDRPEPEKYSMIRNALKQRSARIVDVVIVQRPSIIPNRNQRH